MDPLPETLLKHLAPQLATCNQYKQTVAEKFKAYLVEVPLQGFGSLLIFGE